VPSRRFGCHKMPNPRNVIPPVQTPAVLDQEVWRAWVRKNDLRERATFRRLKIVAGIVLAGIAIGCVYFVWFAR